MNGRALFSYNPDLFKDDEGPVEDNNKQTEEAKDGESG